MLLDPLARARIFIYFFLIYAADPAKAPGLRRSACARTMITLDVCACTPSALHFGIAPYTNDLRKCECIYMCTCLNTFRIHIGRSHEILDEI